MTAREELIRTYIAARNEDRTLTAKETAGFLITQFGVVESAARVRKAKLHETSDYWKEVLNHLEEAS